MSRRDSYHRLTTFAADAIIGAVIVAVLVNLLNLLLG